MMQRRTYQRLWPATALLCSLLLGACAGPLHATTNPENHTGGASAPTPPADPPPSSEDRPPTAIATEQPSVTTLAPSVTLTPDHASTQGHTPESVIRAYYHALDVGACEHAYNLKAATRPEAMRKNMPLAQFIEACQHWERVQIVTLQPYGERWGTADLPPDQRDTAEMKHFVVIFDVEWIAGWEPVIPPGENMQVVTVFKEPDGWKIWDIGF